jgi:hypothetical protein
MPLAGHVRTISGLLEHLGYSNAAAAKVATITIITFVIHHMPDARLVLVKPRHQRGPGRTAASSIIELRETHTACGKPVQIRRIDFAAVTAYVRISHIIGHDQNDVRSLSPASASAQGHYK